MVRIASHVSWALVCLSTLNSVVKAANLGFIEDVVDASIFARKHPIPGIEDYEVRI